MVFFYRTQALDFMLIPSSYLAAPSPLLGRDWVDVWQNTFQIQENGFLDEWKTKIKI